MKEKNVGERMKNTIALMVILLIWPLASPCFAQQTRPLPVYPQSKPARPDVSASERARKLYELARKENRVLRWDSCLARKAVQRAKQLAAAHYFEHEDPKTGKNPVWKTIRTCIPAKSRRSNIRAGENLTKGIDTPANIHRMLMESPTHRANILDRRFNHLGVGCYDAICVELFAGY